MEDGFYTLKGYGRREEAELTLAMEDYLEMLCRMQGAGLPLRAGELSVRLHVRPSSVSKMIRQLNDAGYLHAEKYGGILLTEKGLAAGRYLLYRHRVIHRFLCVLHRRAECLEETEKIEHFLTEETVRRLETLTAFLETAPDDRK